MQVALDFCTHTTIFGYSTKWMESILYLANLCKFSYRGYTNEGYDFANAKVVECGSSKMVVLRRGNAIIFSVAGTDSLEDWLLDADVKLTDLNIDGTRYGKVHRGFLTYILRLWPAMVSEINAFLDCESSAATGNSTPLHTLPECDVNVEIGDNEGSRRWKLRRSVDEDESLRIRVSRRKTFKLQRFRVSLLESMYQNMPMVVFTGHSLGSCCAISAMMAALKFGDRIRVRCITFASPKVGDKHWVRSYHEIISRNFRVVHNNDIVTLLPVGRKYRHLNDEVRLGSKGYYLFRHKGLAALLGRNIFCKCFGVDVNERLIKDHMMDRYIDAIKETLKHSIKTKRENDVGLTIGSMDRMQSVSPKSVEVDFVAMDCMNTGLDTGSGLGVVASASKISTPTCSTPNSSEKLKKLSCKTVIHLY